LIGSGAGAGGSVVAGATVINIGKGAGQLVFGTPAGGSVSNSIAIGNFAGSIGGNATFNGINSISIGERSSAQGQDSISIGAFAGKQEYGLDDAVSGNINIGKNAGAGGTVHGTGNVNIGIGASSGVSYHNYNVSIGTKAADSSSSVEYNVSIGYHSSYSSLNQENCVAIGKNSNHSSLYSSNCVSIGYSAGGYSNNCLNNVMIGWLAGAHSTDSQGNVYIGDNAGESSTSCTQSLFIGPAAGSQAHAMLNAISIQSRLVEGYNKVDFSWIEKNVNEVALIGEQYAIDINNGVQGFMPYVGATLHIGRKLNDFGTAGAATIKSADIKNSALNLTPPTADKSALKLWLCPQTTALSNQSKNLFETQYRSVGASTAPYALANPIINEYGMLRLPLATGVIGSIGTARLVGNGGHDIPKVEGVVALYKITNVGTGIAMCIGTTWHRLNTTTF
jgi:hypothetical protein